MIEKTRHVYPDRALPHYIYLARQHIDRRGRDNYAVAADLLTVAKELYKLLNKSDEEWTTFINDLRVEFKRLPALQDELNKVRL